MHRMPKYITFEGVIYKIMTFKFYIYNGIWLSKLGNQLTKSSKAIKGGNVDDK